jgi:hypothetical protein
VDLILLVVLAIFSKIDKEQKIWKKSFLQILMIFLVNQEANQDLKKVKIYKYNWILNLWKL